MKRLLLALIALFMVIGAAYGAVNTAVCTGCHGAHFEKSAMGKSKIVANMSNDDVVKALVGYKKGTYGGSMKAVMVGQVSKYSIDELKAVKIGKSTKKTESTKKTKSTDQVEVVSQKKEVYTYKQKNVCWSVDYTNKKSHLVDCTSK